MSNTELEPRVLRLWDQLRYAYEHGGGHSGHLNNALHTAKALSKELCKAEAERDALQATLDDYMDDHKAVVNEQCAGDEKHCSCVPHLRKRIKEVEAERDALLVEVERLKGVNYDLAGQLMVLQATKQMQAAIDAARGE